MVSVLRSQEKNTSDYGKILPDIVAFFPEASYNEHNRTPRTSPRFRVMCPRGDIFICGDSAMAIQMKEPTTYTEQLAKLKERGCVIENESACCEVLEAVNYYRLSAYVLPFKGVDQRYKDGTTFSKVYRIYEFDRKLRGILFSAVEEVEIFLRSRFAYYHAHKYGATGYLDSSNYSDRHNAEKFNRTLQREIENNKKVLFVKHHLEKYGGVFPIWAVVELFTFGMLSYFYADMITQDKKQLAERLYQTTPKNLTSWLRCCTDLRNVCAHYGRLYYRIFPAIPAGLDLKDAAKRRLWGAVLVLKSLYPNASKWNSEVLSSVHALFDEYAEDIDLYHMAFPADWLERLRK